MGEPRLDFYMLGDKWPTQIRADILKLVDGAVLHPATWKIDIKSMKSQWWCFFYDCEAVSPNILKALHVLTDPDLRNPKTEKRYNGFTFFLLNNKNTKEIYYSTRMVHKDTPFDFNHMHPLIDDGFERILDGWIYTSDVRTSLSTYYPARR